MLKRRHRDLLQFPHPAVGQEAPSEKRVVVAKGKRGCGRDGVGGWG